MPVQLLSDRMVNKRKLCMYVTNYHDHLSEEKCLKSSVYRLAYPIMPYCSLMTVQEFKLPNFLKKSTGTILNFKSGSLKEWMTLWILVF